jgi:hypothetical protein
VINSGGASRITAVAGALTKKPASRAALGTVDDPLTCLVKLLAGKVPDLR